MKDFILSKEECNILLGYATSSPLITIRSKSQCVLMLSRDIPISDICFLINRKERTIWQWKNEFLYSRISSIFTNHANNDNASKLTKDQKAKIKRTLSQPPNEYGLPKDFWDPPSLKEYC